MVVHVTYFDGSEHVVEDGFEKDVLLEVTLRCLGGAERMRLLRLCGKRVVCEGPRNAVSELVSQLRGIGDCFLRASAESDAGNGK